MHDRAGGHRGLPTAISALVGEGFGLQQPGPAAAATRTDKPFRPPALEKVHRTRAFRRKAFLKFDQRPRKPSLRSRHHPTPRSSRYRGAAYSLVLVLYTKSRSTGRSCIGRRLRSKNVASYKVSKDRNLCMGRAACDGQSRVRGNFFQIPTDRPTMPPLRLPRPTPAALSSPTAPAGCAIPCALGIDIAAARQAVEGDLLYKLRDDRNPLSAGTTPF